MANPLLDFWLRLLGQEAPDERRPSRLSRRQRRRIPRASEVQAEATIFLVLRRMRVPLIVLILIFAVSVFGLTLVPGQDPVTGATIRMTFFDAFYFMSYTASTIGFGELPVPFTPAQRLWVTVSIYLTVIGWAYAIGSLLALLQDRAFRQALALQHFTRKVKRLREPFLLIVGHGRTGELLSKAFDELGKRVVVIDIDPERIESLELGSYHADVPGLVADARDPAHLGVAGLANPGCHAVLAITNDDEANLTVTMTAALLRPDLQVIARTTSTSIAERMRAFGEPTVVDPFDRFGEHLGLGIRAPASYQLITWLESGPGAALPNRGHPPADGRWVVCGYGRFGRELVADLHREGIEVTVIEAARDGGDDAPEGVVGDGADPDVLERAGVADAAGFVAGVDNDASNLSMIAAVRRLNPDVFVAARQNRPSSSPLFAAMETDALLVPPELVAHEVYAQLSTPLLWRFVQEVPHRDDEWAAGVVDRLVELTGKRRLPPLWKVRLDRAEAPALQGWLRSGEGRTGAVLRDPDERDQRLAALVLMVLRDGECLLVPDDDLVLQVGDELLLAGSAAARRGLDATMLVGGAAEYVRTGRRVATGWLWRKFQR
ncbi:potassium channel family protein [Pseudonocardia humida]|uniref:Potassium channel protein n=1 Tax=Pseudonocardia humida TaxID=2800819 RepID=A0ABT0ZTK4_9PSEU|nr:NAD-binding protein [Pseudonocardia humida]MCO1654014.1 potassium channel protein [Pseudonocardia humida]